MINNKSNRNVSLGIVVLMMLMMLCPSSLWAWDMTPDPVTGKYDRLYDRPTYFPDWEQPLTWPNNQVYLCEVFVGSEKIANYEIAVYDQNNKLRHCARSIARDDDQCVLTIRGVEGDRYHFKVIYGDDFANPIIADIPDVTIGFRTNDVVGAEPDPPFALVIPGRTVLSETSVKMPKSGEGVDVTVRRTLNAGEWNTICLPFSMSASQLTAAFGSDVVLGDFTGCDVDFESDGNTVSSINLNFSRAASLAANHPYVIKVGADVKAFDLDNVNIVVDEDALSVDRDRIGEGTKRNPYRYNSFVGNYLASTLVPEECLSLIDGSLSYSDGTAPLKAYSAYFDFYDVLEAANPKTTASVSADAASLMLHSFSFADITFTGSDHWMTYCSDVNLALPEGVRAYVVTGYGDDEVYVKEADCIAADAPMLLYRDDVSVATFRTRTVSSASVPAGNLLRVTATAQHVDVASCYVLYQDEFVLVSEATMPAATIYLPLPSGNNPARRRIVFDGNSTGVGSIAVPESSSQRYDLRGVRMNSQSRPTVVYVVDGKKYLIK